MIAFPPFLTIFLTVASPKPDAPPETIATVCLMFITISPLYNHNMYAFSLIILKQCASNNVRSLGKIVFHSFPRLLNTTVLPNSSLLTKYFEQSLYCQLKNILYLHPLVINHHNLGYIGHVNKIFLLFFFTYNFHLYFIPLKYYISFYYFSGNISLCLAISSNPALSRIAYSTCVSIIICNFSYVERCFPLTSFIFSMLRCKIFNWL